MKQREGIIGEKAKGLIELSALFGQAVPNFLILRFEELFEDYRELQERTKHLANEYIKKRISDSEYEDRIKHIVESTLLQKSALERIGEEMEQRGFTKVSYRTSATNEDLIDHSFAGQYLTILDADTDIKTLTDSARSCFRSLFSPRVLKYANHQGIPFDQDGSLIIQKMFYGSVSGVLFTENGQNEIEVSYVLSWKNKVVEGENSFNLKIPRIEPENFRLPPNLPQTFQKVLGASRLLEAKLGKPLDIEWSANNSEFALLQTRPITKIDLTYIIEWDNTNISESYPGITLPLTYSFIRRNYARVYPEFLKLLGRKEPDLEPEKDIFENMLGYLHGNVYYNINNWYELIKLVPGYQYNKQFFEAMLMPAKNKPTETMPPPRSFKDKLFFVSDLIKFVVLLLRTDTLSSRFTKNYLKKYTLYTSVQWEHINIKKTLILFEKIEYDLLRTWAVPILNDFRTMVAHGLLKKMYFPEKNDARYLDFLKGIYDQTSIEPVRELGTITKKIRGVAKKTPHKDRLTKDILSGTYPDIHDAIKDYLVRFGGRSPDELKLENPRLDEDIVSFTKFVISSSMQPHEVEFKNDSPVAHKERMDGSRWNILKRILFPVILKGTKAGISKRERFRFYRAQCFNLARQTYLAIGTRFQEAHILKERKDIFWLTHEEIRAFILGHSIETNAKEMVRRRKRLFQSYKKKRFGRRTVSAGLVAANSITTDPAIHKPEVGGSHKILTGLGVSPGIFTGKAVVIEEFDPETNVAGKVLVASHTDPGWTLLFLNAGAVVVERGNALSHASIVSRELGIPAIVGLEGICDMIKNNDRIVVNGSTGELTIL